MATVTSQRQRDRWIVMHTDWAGYTAMDRVRGEKAVPRIFYLDGRMTLVSPSYLHELMTERLGMMVKEVVVGLRIPHVPAGKTTFRKKRKRGGVEADQSYYFANALQLAGKRDIDLRVDPPPELVIEAVVSHPVKDALEIYRRLGVREVWVCNGRVLRFLILQPDSRYAESPVSAAMPFLTSAEVLGWVQRPHSGDETEWQLELRRWVAETLAPRFAEWKRAHP